MDESISSDQLSRRGFLGRAAALGAVAATGSGFLSACASGGQAATGASALRAAVGVNHPIGIQLYTVRDLSATDFPGTLEKVAEIGYKEFEFAGYGNLTPNQIRALLDRLQVTAPSSHLGVNLFRDNLERTIEDSRTMGHQYLVVPSANGRTVEGWTQLAADFNRWGAAVRAGGMRFGYHNHAAEFADLGGGVTPYDILLRETDPDLVDMELDLYWAIRGGQDPVAMFRRNPGRFKLFHVKDMTDRAGSQAMAPVGEGEIDFRAIFEQARLAGAVHFFVEHDNAAQWPGGSLASITASYRNLRALLP